MTSPVRGFWEGEKPDAVRRICLAFLLSPLIVGALMMVFAFMVAGVQGGGWDKILGATLGGALVLFITLFVFMLTFGIAGVVALWFLGQRGMLAWAVCGALMGAVASVLVGELLMGGAERPVVIGSAVGGWVIFLLFRWIAGIRDELEP